MSMAWSLAAGGGRGRQPSPGLALRATQQTPSLCREPAGPRPADRYRPRRPPQQRPFLCSLFVCCFCPSQARPPVHAWLTSLSFPATALARLQAESTHPGFSPETACCLYATDEFSFGLLPLGKKKKKAVVLHSPWRASPPLPSSERFSAGPPHPPRPRLLTRLPTLFGNRTARWSTLAVRQFFLPPYFCPRGLFGASVSPPAGSGEALAGLFWVGGCVALPPEANRAGLPNPKAPTRVGMSGRGLFFWSQENTCLYCACCARGRPPPRGSRGFCAQCIGCWQDFWVVDPL